MLVNIINRYQVLWKKFFLEVIATTIDSNLVFKKIRKINLKISEI